MKRIQFFLLVIICLSFKSFSQDLIIELNGTVIKSKVLEIGMEEVKYKKWDFQDGPSYTIRKEKIFLIHYSNGNTDVFNSVEKEPEVEMASGISDQQLAEDESLYVNDYGYSHEYAVGDAVIFFKGWEFLHASIAAFQTNGSLVQLDVEGQGLRIVRYDEIFPIDSSNSFTCQGAGGEFGEEFIFRNGDEIIFYHDRKLIKGRLNHVHPYRPYGEVETILDHEIETINLLEVLWLDPDKMYMPYENKEMKPGKDIVFYSKNRFHYGKIIRIERADLTIVKVRSLRPENGVAINKEYTVIPTMIMWLLE